MTTIGHEIQGLQALAHILRLRIRKPSTCPRRAIEAEEELAGVEAKIADLTAKIEDAAGNIVPFEPAAPAEPAFPELWNLIPNTP